MSLPHGPSAAHGSRQHRLVSLTMLLALLASLLVTSAVTAPQALAAPATPTTLPRAIEAYQPYVGQSICDPVAKPGVRAFANLLLDTYRNTSSLGIVRDCGSGGQSEHKEGRAWDWGAVKGQDDAAVADVLRWLLKTDAYGNAHANARRLGIMYMIWDRKIFKFYQASLGWQTYSGSSPHTDHVHFSFGWNGAKKVTSFWDGTVAPIDYGPGGPPRVVPVVTPDNILVRHTYGGTSLKPGSTGTAVKVLQTRLKITADGVYGSGTKASVTRFQSEQGLPVTGSWGPADWKKLLPYPIKPFGAIERSGPALGPTLISGWAIDADTDTPLEIQLFVDGATTPAAKAPTDYNRADLTKKYPPYPTRHGFRIPVQLSDDKPHTVCAKAINAPGTPGSNTSLGCLSNVVVQHSPLGRLDSVQQRPEGIMARGWAIDPDTADSIGVRLTVDGGVVPVTATASTSRPDLLRYYPAYGDKHGFLTPLSMSQGVHQVCAQVPNAVGTPGSDVSLGCRSVTVRHDPLGLLNPIKSVLGKVIVSGRSLDPDTGAASSVQVKVDGKAVTTVPANLAGTAIPNYTAYGTQRAFRAELSLAQGAHEVCSYAVNAPGTPGVATLIGCQTITVNHRPIGTFERFRQAPGGKSVIRGWAADPDTTAPLTVRVTINGVAQPDLTASADRPDVATLHPDLGAAHGYSAAYALPDGSHKVCLTYVNAAGTPGSDLAPVCRSLTVRHSPIGSAPTFTRVPAGVIVKGWALDLDSTSAVPVQVLVNGVQKAALTANLARTDVSKAYPGYGSGHGYATAALKLAQGTHTVCINGTNITGTLGKNTRLACRDVVVNHNPVGKYDPIAVYSSYIHVAGWAVDLDSTKPVTVRVTVDGVKKADLVANLSRGDLSGRFPGYGTARGWHVHLTPSRGTHTVCARAYNVVDTPGVSTSLGCRSVTF